jgi:hypothetical protein
MCRFADFVSLDMDPITLMVSTLSVRVAFKEEPETVPLIIPDGAQEPVRLSVPETALPAWLRVPQTSAEPPLDDT